MDGEYYIVAVLVVAFIGYHFLIVPAGQVPATTEIPEITPIPTPTIITVNETTADIEPWDMTMFRTTGRYLNETFEWRRDNVSGLKDMDVFTVVYDYKIMHGYEWWSESWGRYFYQIPDAGKKFLFVFVNTWMEGSDPSMDPRMWGPDWNHYYVQYQGKILSRDETYLPPIRIREFEDRSELRDAVRVGPYGFLNYQEIGSGKRSAIPLMWLRMGRSNAWDGFIVYQIPEDADPSDLVVLGDMYSFGQPYWLLKERP